MSSGLRFSTEFNIGVKDDFRVPDETFAKFGFYARHSVDEILVADPQTGTVRIWQRRGHSYEETGRSDLLDVSADAIGDEISWP